MAISNSSNADFLAEYLRNWYFVKCYALAFKLTLFKHNRFYHEAIRMGLKNPSIADCVISDFRERILRKYQDRIIRIILEAVEK